MSDSRLVDVTSWPPATLLDAREAAGRGRGLFAADDIAAGAPVHCEVPIVTVSPNSTAAAEWGPPLQIVLALLEYGVKSATAELHPRERIVDDTDSGIPLPRAEVDTALGILRGDGSHTWTAADDELERLLQVAVLNAIELTPPGSARRRYGLCARGSLFNHSCQPNATHQGFVVGDGGGACLCVRAVRDIRKGEEVTISYVADLADAHGERAEQLKHHGFGAELRPCDAPLDEWLMPDGDERAKRTEEIGARNVAADAAWTAAHGGGGDARAQLMASATHYAALLALAKGALGERHALVTNARSRLAHVMTASAAPRSCANALPLWREVLRATRACCGDVWPALLVPLRGGVRAAKAASDAAAEAEFGAELERVLAVLRPACDDVA